MAQEFEEHDAVLCVDCYTYAHTGEEPESSPEGFALSKLTDPRAIIGTCEDGEEYFTWHYNCDGCETELAGTRYPVKILDVKTS